MSVKVAGTLSIKAINGANGRFCVGDLNTPIGEFKVKDPILDQFEEGRYEGEFVIERFFLSSYVWRGKSTTDIRAQVSDIFLDTADEGAIDPVQSEPDPLVTDARQTAVRHEPTTHAATIPTITTMPAEPVSATVIDQNEQDEGTQQCRKLFGSDLAPAVLDGQDVKLDPTVDRNQFREQRDALKAMGYVFDAKTQIWRKQADIAEAMNA